MREIKFRTWDNKNNKMEYNPYGDEFSCEGTPINQIFKGYPFEDGTLELMQYTGKKDSKGKEIYEGDIIEFEREEWGGDDNIHIVEWDEYNAEWSWGGGCTGDMEFRTVIGNIYENKDFLK